jgi:hypothetical protein
MRINRAVKAYNLMKKILFLSAIALFAFLPPSSGENASRPLPREDGYRGIWFADLPSDDEYKYTYYSGGLGTYTADHIPLAQYSKEAGKTFFCYGGAAGEENTLLTMISFYDHRTGTFPRPATLLHKGTDDAHDNPTLMLDAKGYIWVFVAAHGTVRPSYIYRSDRPYSIDAFTLMRETNFSYPQPWYIKGKGFLFLHTRYLGGRFLYWMTSRDGISWSETQKLAAIAQGHYQVSWLQGKKVGTAFNYHPEAPSSNWADPTKPGVKPELSGTNNRTNLYYIATDDFGNTWKNAAGETVEVPLTTKENGALVHDYAREKLLVYLMDMAFDSRGNPVILYLTSRGSKSGPENDPRTWTTAHWNGKSWDIRPVTTSDNNYDMGSIYIEKDGSWLIIGPTGTGPQAYNCGGEIALWTSANRGQTWKKTRRITTNSLYNHSYVRKPVNANPDFYAFWADGSGREPSPSRLYFCNRAGDAWQMPETMVGDNEKPVKIQSPASDFPR